MFRNIVPMSLSIAPTSPTPRRAHLLSERITLMITLICIYITVLQIDRLVDGLPERISKVLVAILRAGLPYLDAIEQDIHSRSRVGVSEKCISYTTILY